MAFVIPVSWPRIEPILPAVEAWVLTIGLPGKCLVSSFSPRFTMYLETHEAWAPSGTKVPSRGSVQVRDTTIPPGDTHNALLFGNCHLTNAFQWVPFPPTICCLGLKVQMDHQLSCLPWTHLPLPKKSAFERIALLLFSLSVMSYSVTPWTAAHQASPSFTISRSLHKLMLIESVMPFNHLIFCHPLLPPSSIFPSIRVFSNESTLSMKWPKDCSFHFSISPSNEYSGLISFKIDWFDLLAIQGTLKSLLQHHSSKASILWCSAFFVAQLSHPYMTTGKTTEFWLYGPLSAEWCLCTLIRCRGLL